MNEIERAEVGFAQVKNEVLFDPKISLKAKGLFAYIYAKPTRWDFSGDRIAKEIKEGRDAIYAGLTELEKEGYLVRLKLPDGRVRYKVSHNKKPVEENPQMAVNEPVEENPYLGKSQLGKSRSISKKELNKERGEEIKTVTNVTEQSYGNADINWVLEEFERIMEFASQGKKQQDRFMAKHLLANFSKEQIKGMLMFCANDSYAPRVGSVEKLWFKRGEIIAGIKSFQKKSNQSLVASI